MANDCSTINPGPIRYPCGICGKAVRCNQRAIESKDCSTWFHKACLDMNDAHFEILEQHPSYVWLCCQCGLPNFSSSLFLSDIKTSNRFDTLTDLSSTSYHSLSRDNIKLININCQSVTSKKAKFLAVLEDEDPDIVVGTESWLSPEHNSSEVFPPHYQVFRKDRKSDAHGGVFIAAKTDLVAVSRVDLADNDSELLWIQLSTSNSSSVFIGAFYRPPSSDEVYVENLRASQEKIPVQDNVWLLGDFNLPNVDWAVNRFQPSGRYPSQSKAMIDIILDHNLQQLVEEPTRGRNILDLFLTNNDSLVQHIRVKPGISDHDYVEISCLTKPQRVKSPSRHVFIWKKANFQAISDDIINLEKASTAFSRPYEPADVESMWNAFQSTLTESIVRNIPCKSLTNKQPQPWIDIRIRRALRKKERLYRNAKRSGTDEAWSLFKKHRRSVDRLIRKQHREYVSSIGVSLETNNTKPFWNYIKSLKLNAFGISTLTTKFGNTVSLAKAKADALNQQFQSVFTSENIQSMPAMDNLGFRMIAPLVIDPTGVFNLLTNLKENKAPGPDGIPPRVLKYCASSIAPVLQKIYQASIDTSYLPRDWRTANITPIFKKGDRTNPENYRPVSLTSVPCKVLEHIVYRYLITYIEDNNILSDVQHGFRKRRGCDTQLVLLVEELAHALDQRKQIDLVIMDFCKAFDKVPHNRLMLKLQQCGIEDPIHGWLKCFLTQRSQQVVLEGTKSEEATVASGVPQGTVLGPLLFLIYINDIHDNIDSQMRLFADDCLIHRVIKSDADCVKLQNDLSILCGWESEWQMEFNKSKCFVLHMSHKKQPIINIYNLEDTPLETSTKQRYLGVDLSADLDWSYHINSIASKANKTLGLLRRNLKHCTPKIKSIAYKALVRPQLEYCSAIWDPYEKGDIATLEKVQRRAARFVSGDYGRESSVTNMINNIGWPSLLERRAATRLTLMFKIVHGYVDINTTLLQTGDRITRQSSPLTYKHIHANKNCYRSSFFPRTIPEWNMLPLSLRSASTINNFKSGLSQINMNHIITSSHYYQ